MSPSIFDLTDKVAIVTGGGRGIGKAIALGLAQAGADVVVAARTVKEIEETADQIRNEGKRALAIHTNVLSAELITEMLQKTLEAFGKVDILVNNAGGDSGGGHKDPSSGFALNLTFDGWKEGIELNLNSLFLCSKIIGSVMVEKCSGNIINISSGMGLGPFPGAIHHAAARAGVINFTQTLSLEWASYNIRVNAIAPGYTLTPLMAKTMEMDPIGGKAILKNIPLGRFAKPEEIAALAVFLASPAASYITGETISASGGLITTVHPGWIEYSSNERDRLKKGAVI